MNFDRFDTHTCLAVCTIQTETTYLLIPIALVLLLIFSAPVILWKLKENPWLILFTFLFSFLMVPIFGIQFDSSGCGSGCEKNSRTTNVKLWHGSEATLWEEI